MATPVFNPSVAPNFGTNEVKKARTNVMQFGNGYEQRTEDGINHVRSEFNSFRWSNLTYAEWQEIDAFFTARGGVEAFEWTPVGETKTFRLVCEEWGKEQVFLNTYNVHAKVREVFDL